MNGIPLPALRPLYLAAAGGVLLITGVMFALRHQVGPNATLGPTLGYAAAALLLAAVGAVQLLRARTLAALREDEAGALAALQADMAPRRAVLLLVLPLMLLEAPALLAAVGLLFHGPTWLLAIPALSAASLAWAMPTKDNLLNALNA